MTTYANENGRRSLFLRPNITTFPIALALGLAPVPGGVSARQSIKQPNRALPTVISEEERLEVVAVPATVAPAIDSVLGDTPPPPPPSRGSCPKRQRGGRERHRRR